MKVGVQDVKKVTGDCNGTNSNTMTVMFLDDWIMQVVIMKGSSSSSMLAADDSDYSWRSIELTYIVDKKVFPDAGKISTKICLFRQLAQEAR